jgi:hypothetical protein
MSVDPQSSQEWRPCDSGLLVGFARRARSERRNRVVSRVAAGAAVVLLAVSVGLWGSGRWSGNEENYFGGIACHEVGKNLPAMMAGTISDELRAKVEEHLRQCPRCQEAMRKMEAGQTSGHAANWRGRCECPQCQHRELLAIAIASTHGDSLTELLSMIDRPATSALSGRN